MNRRFKETVRLGIVFAFATFAALFCQSKAGRRSPQHRTAFPKRRGWRVLLAIDYDANPRLPGLDMMKRSIFERTQAGPGIPARRSDVRWPGEGDGSDHG